MWAYSEHTDLDSSWGSVVVRDGGPRDLGQCYASSQLQAPCVENKVGNIHLQRNAKVRSSLAPSILHPRPPVTGDTGSVVPTLVPPSHWLQLV